MKKIFLKSCLVLGGITFISILASNPIGYAKSNTWVDKQFLMSKDSLLGEIEQSKNIVERSIKSSEIEMPTSDKGSVDYKSKNISITYDNVGNENYSIDTFENFTFLRKENSTTVIRQEEDNTIVHSVIESSEELDLVNAEYDFSSNTLLRLEKLTSVSDGTETGLYHIVDDKNFVVATIDKPTVYDNNGNQLEAHYEHVGDKLKTVISTDEDTLYPLTARRSTFFTYFTKLGWDYRADGSHPSGGRWSVWMTPSPSMRVMMAHQFVGIGALIGTSPYAQDAWSWVQRISSSHYLWSNTNGLKDQFYCHFLFAGFKNQFNLEPSRPNVGLIRTIASSCNP
ncbi:DUF2599 domain-containing protein [Carnobacterium divergens]|uniref:DUF2599 domain-containing protein n=1 Tax=Carnobacterium divergens TaxID=2748 RepID=UPI00288F6052|nr:DUF2599 domain-containing protein [Carnobacterium divergens]MDT2011939.1 DUF2599 domain-containing protein [Carnobacterium divergens]